MPLSDNIKRIRQLKKISVADLAKEMGANVQSIYAWERGEYDPNKENLESMARIFKVPVKTFYDENITEVDKPTDNSGKAEIEDVYRNIVEGNTEYILIPRSVLQEKYRLVALEQFQKDKEQMDKDKSTIDRLLTMNENLIAEMTSMKTKLPVTKTAKQNA